MFKRRILAVALLVAGSALSSQTLAREPGRDGRDRASPPRGIHMLERPRPPRDAALRQLRRADSNGDRQLSNQEFVSQRTQRHELQFGRLDVDQNGLLSSDELQTPPGDRRRRPLDAETQANPGARNPSIQATERFASADVSGDGALDAQEHMALLEQRSATRFAQLDADSDGVLTARELATSLRGRMEQRRGIRAPLRNL